MKTLNQKMIELSQYLQTLAKPEFSTDVEEAVKKQDKNALIQICRRAKIPANYASSVIATILSVSPQKWPTTF